MTNPHERQGLLSNVIAFVIVTPLLALFVCPIFLFLAGGFALYSMLQVIFGPRPKKIRERG